MKASPSGAASIKVDLLKILIRVPGNARVIPPSFLRLPMEWNVALRGSRAEGFQKRAENEAEIR